MVYDNLTTMIDAILAHVAATQQTIESLLAGPLCITFRSPTDIFEYPIALFDNEDWSSADALALKSYLLTHERRALLAEGFSQGQKIWQSV